MQLGMACPQAEPFWGGGRVVEDGEWDEAVFGCGLGVCGEK